MVCCHGTRIRVDAKDKKHIRDFRFDKDELFQYQTRIQKVGEHIFVYCNNGKFDYTSRQHGGPVSQACAVYTSRQRSSMMANS